MITDLVISGGGIKELYVLGGLLYLEDMNMLRSVKHYYGTSAGSVCSMLLVLGYDVKKIINLASSLNLYFSRTIEFNSCQNFLILILLCLLVITLLSS